MPGQKKRITFDEFIDELMIMYVSKNQSYLLAEIRTMLETSWSRDNVVNALVREGRELIDDAVEQEPLKCQSCNEILNEITLRTVHVETFRVTKDFKDIWLKFERKETKNPVIEHSRCAKCGARFDLSDFDTHFVK